MGADGELRPADATTAGEPWRERPLTLLGSTGSIGRSTLAVAEELGIPIHAITANNSVEALAEQARRYRPRWVVAADAGRYAELRAALADVGGVEVAAGADALAQVAADEGCGAVVTAIVGGAGLPATLSAVRAGKRVCIANKEPLVMAGELIMAAARRHGAHIVPVDSEHSAIFQCIDGHGRDEVRRIVLTGSGGPFRTRDDLAGVTLAEALEHPTWSMGPKITVDSATLMNKSLEIIEARWLFDVAVDDIELLIHPQSIVHSLVAFADGSTMAQLALPDMRVPIQYALTWPRHAPGTVAGPDLAALGRLDFAAPDRTRFPSVDMGYDAARRGGLAPAVMNAANEVAVERFIAGDIRFLDIFRLVAEALAAAPECRSPSLDDILAADAEVRARHGAAR